MNTAELVESHVHLVRRVARHVARRLPRHVGLDDLVGAGHLGLVDAARRYDPARGVPFDAYAGIRIRGAIMDDLRGADFVPRRVRDREDAIVRARTAACKAGVAATDDEVERRLGVEPGGLSAWAAAGQPKFVPYDTLTEDETGVDGERMAADASVERREQFEAVHQAVAALPERLQTVLHLYYVEGLTLREIAQVIGVTESRVCQLHGRAVANLRESLRS